MLVDIEQWHAEIGNFNWCLHYAIIRLEMNLFNIMVRVSQVLALILAIIFQYVFKINRAFHFLNIIFVFVLLFIVLKFTVTNIGLCFEFNQHCHKQLEIILWRSQNQISRVSASKPPSENGVPKKSLDTSLLVYF